MQYILIQTADDRTLYQEIERGFVQRICTLEGDTVPQLTVPHWVLDANPPQPSWALPDTPVPMPIPLMIISKLEFRNKFTFNEKAAIYAAAETNVAIKVWLDDLASCEQVDLLSTQTQQGLQFLVSVGLLSEARKAEILNA